MSLLSMLRTTGTLRRKTPTNKDASGGMVMVYANVSGQVDVPCDIQPASGTVRMQFMEMQANVSHTVFTQADTGAKAGDVWYSNSRTFMFRGKEVMAPGYPVWACKMHVEEQLG